MTTEPSSTTILDLDPYSLGIVLSEAGCWHVADEDGNTRTVAAWSVCRVWRDCLREHGGHMARLLIRAHGGRRGEALQRAARCRSPAIDDDALAACILDGCEEEEDEAGSLRGELVRAVAHAAARAKCSVLKRILGCRSAEDRARDRAEGGGAPFSVCD